ncbi:hypothetical protein [Paenibacillus yanchengensis]|uniref:Uncharacterized protein n=1 Tax=Paenibacillus yanchengensis TaxID=2035833 RepID=A0ABW4YGL2_9BACL
MYEDKLLVLKNLIGATSDTTATFTDDKNYLADEDAFLYFDGDKVVLTENQELILKAQSYSINSFLKYEEDGEINLMHMF